MLTVLFVDGKEKQYDADTASKAGSRFFLHKWNKESRKYETCETAFPADEVVWAEYPNGRKVLGDGKRTS
jgi:hypothetical protein